METELRKLELNFISSFNIVNKDTKITSVEGDFLQLSGLGVFDGTVGDESPKPSEAANVAFSMIHSELTKPGNIYELQQEIRNRDIELETLKQRNSIFAQPIANYKRQYDQKVLELAETRRLFEEMVHSNDECRLDCQNINMTLRNANKELELRNQTLETRIASLDNEVSGLAEDLVHLRNKHLIIAGGQLLDEEISKITNQVTLWSEMNEDQELEMDKQYFERLKAWMRGVLDKLDEKLITERRQYGELKQDMELRHAAELKEAREIHLADVVRLRHSHEKHVESINEFYREKLSDQERMFAENLKMLNLRSERDQTMINEMQAKCSNVSQELQTRFNTQYENDMRNVKNLIGMTGRVQFEETVTRLRNELSAAHERLRVLQEQYSLLAVMKADAERALEQSQEELSSFYSSSSTTLVPIKNDQKNYITQLEQRNLQIEGKLREMEQAMHDMHNTYREELENLKGTDHLTLQQNNVCNNLTSQTIINTDAAALQRVLHLENENAMLVDKLDESLAKNKLLKQQNETERANAQKYKDAMWKINSESNMKMLSDDTMTTDMDAVFNETFLSMVKARQTPPTTVQQYEILKYSETVSPQDKILFAQIVLSILTRDPATYNDAQIDFNIQFDKTIQLLFRMSDNYNPQQLVDYFNGIDPLKGTDQRLIPLQQFVLNRPFELQSHMYNGVCKRVMDVGMLVKSMALYKSSDLGLAIRGRNAAGRVTKNRITIFSEKTTNDLMSIKTTPKGKIARRLAMGVNA